MRRRSRTISPKNCERVLNYNGFYLDKQDVCYVVFRDDIDRHISIHRGNVDIIEWKRIVKDNELVEPMKAFK